MQTHVHVALNTARLEESIDFYTAFFGRPPVKTRPGYAKFELSQPALNFTLNEAPADASPQRRDLNHLGLQVDSSDGVRQAAERLTEHGLELREEWDTVCCYARQDKIWATDPDGNAWEIFAVTEADVPAETTRRTATDGAAACCA